MFFTLANAISWLTQYGYSILFPITIIEGPIITVIAGFLAAQGIFNIFAVYAVVVIGDVAGDAIYYGIGRWGGLKFINRWGRFIGLNAEKLTDLENHFASHSGKTLIFGKLSHAIGAPILVAAGIAKIPFLKFINFNFWATLPKSLLLVAIGYYFGQAYAQINKYINYGSAGIFVIILALIGGYAIMVRLSRKKEHEGEKLN